jgi:hypothetical protein
MVSQPPDQRSSDSSTGDPAKQNEPTTDLLAANRQALLLLDALLSEPDDLGDEWWDAFKLELRSNRFTIEYSEPEPTDSETSP